MNSLRDETPQTEEPTVPPPRICPFCRIPLPLAFDCTLCGRWKESLDEQPVAISDSDRRKETLR